MNKYIRKSTEEDVDAIANNMRNADIREVKSLVGRTPHEALKLGLEFSDPCFTLIGDDGELLGMCGVAPSPDKGVGAIWMLGTTSLSKYAIQFIRNSKEVIDYLIRDYPLVYNVVDARNTLHLRWLRWAGFTFLKKHEECGVDKIPAYEFIRINNV